MYTRSIVTVLALGASLGVAKAADVYQPEPTPVPQALPTQVDFDWTRFYVGVNAGHAWGDFDSDLGSVVAPFTVTNPLAGADGFIGGVQGGYNYQFHPNFVAGIEAEINYTENEDGIRVMSGLATVATGEADLEYLGSVTGRLGYLPLARTLVYAKGGYAFGSVDVDLTTGSDSNFHHGWTIGAGVEQAVHDNVSVKLEYGYTDLFDEDFSVGLARDVEADFETHTVRAGVNWLF